MHINKAYHWPPTSSLTLATHLAIMLPRTITSGRMQGTGRGGDEGVSAERVREQEAIAAEGFVVGVVARLLPHQLLH